MKTRILVAIPIAIVVILAIFVQGWILAVFAVALGLMAQFETVRALNASANPPVRVVSMTYAALLALLFIEDYSLSPLENSARIMDAEMLLLLLCFGTMAVFVCAMLNKKQTFEGAVNTIFTLIYPALFLTAFYLIILWARNGLDPKADYVTTMVALLVLFLPPIFSDTIAYFWGSKFGKTKIAPIISPKKTMAGSVAGAIGGALGALLVYWVGTLFCGQEYSLLGGPWIYIVMGIILAILSQFGDLAASYLKRAVGIKDYGKLLPGHGGVMDRIDSTMFIMPVVYMFLRLPWIGIAF